MLYVGKNNLKKIKEWMATKWTKITVNAEDYMVPVDVAGPSIE